MRQCFSLGGERQGVELMWAWGRFLGDRNVLYLVLDDSYMGYSIFKTHQIEHLRSMYFIFSKLYLNIKI